MELEVGMYVRTDKGELGKIIKIEKGYKEKLLYFLNVDLPSYAHIEEEFTKASYNIIDLIEVGDVIEVKEFKGKYEVRQFGLELSIVKLDTIYNLNSLHCTLNIKSIVTKEQFEQMQYKVGE